MAERKVVKKRTCFKCGTTLECDAATLKAKHNPCTGPERRLEDIGLKAPSAGEVQKFS